MSNDGGHLGSGDSGDTPGAGADRSPWAAPSGGQTPPPVPPVPPAPEGAQPTTPLAVAAPGGEQPPRRRFPVGAIVAVAVAGLVVVLVVAVLAAVALGRAVTGGGAARDGGSGDGSSQGVRAASPKEFVRGYLTAIAKGDAAKATTYLSEQSTSNPLLTSEVLKRSAEIEPISDVAVGAVTGSKYFPDVAVTYTLGSDPVSTSFHVYARSDGTYTITSGLARVSAGYLKGLDITVNGVATTMPTNGLELFPGAYEIAVTTPNLTLGDAGDVELAGPDSRLEYDALKPTLTDEAAKRFRTLVTASANACLKQRTLAAGCGLGIESPFSDGTKIDQGTVKRSSTPELRAKLARLEPQPDLDTPTLVSARVGESPDVTARGTKSGRSGTIRVLFGPSLGTAYVDFSEADPTVEWR